MVVDAARHDALALAQRAGDAELGRDGLADEGALVGQLVEQVGELVLDLEGDDGVFGGLRDIAVSPAGGFSTSILLARTR